MQASKANCNLPGRKEKVTLRKKEKRKEKDEKKKICVENVLQNRKEIQNFL